MMIKQEGFSYTFNPSACESCGGRCCTGESGYIWISPKEANAMAKSLDLSLSLFAQKYLLKIGYKLSIKEKAFQDGYACVFFDEDKKQCSVYETRPKQCRSFPFWDYFKSNLSELEKECPGISL